MKRIKYLVIASLIGGGIFFVYKIITFNLFDGELVLVDKVPVNDCDYSILIYRYPSSATIEGAIQIHLIQDNTGNSKYYKSYDRYNKVTLAQILPRKVLELGLQDTVKSNLKIDTIRVTLPKRY